MGRLFLASLLFFVYSDMFAARSQEPVVITTCRSFGARCDEQSKIALQNRFKPAGEQNCGDCDDINKVCANAVLSFDGIMQGDDGKIALEAFYPDGNSYKYFILFNFRENDSSAAVEYWASSSADFKRSTYAIAISDEDKAGYDAIFKSAEIAPSVIPAIIYSLANDMSLTDEPQLARRQFDLALLSILEAMGGGMKGYDKAFVKSDSWFDISKRMSALKILRDYVLDNPKLFNINPALDAEGRDFAYYMKKFSDEYAARTREQFRLECKDFNEAESPILDEDALKKAESFSKAFSCKKNSQSGKEPRFKSLRLKKPKSRRR